MTLPQTSTRSTGSDLLDQLRAMATDIGETEVAEAARRLAERIAEGRFYVACLGQFKRGKSTLINALIGMPLLPVGIAPVTAAITIVRYGDRIGARVVYEDSRSESVEPSALEDYVSEQRNPGNVKHVRVVEVAVPSELLASGMCLVDTPGLGSIFRQNTETTRAFLPHIDAALFVLGADPPISGEEAAVAEAIAREVPRMLFVLNKADRFSVDDVAEAAAFTRDALTQRTGREVCLFTVSAIERLDGDYTHQWLALEAALTALARDAGADLVRDAEERGRRRLEARLVREIERQRDALTRPIAETERRATALRQTIDDARRTLSDLGYLFTAEQHRLTRELDGEQMRFLDATTTIAAATLDAALAATRWRSHEHAFDTAEQIARDAIRNWMEQIEPRAEELYVRATDRFVALARDFLRRVDVDADDLDVEFEQHFRKRSGFYFTSLATLTGRPPGACFVDFLSTTRRQRERAHRHANAYLRRLLESNAARVANDLTDRVLESRRFLEREIRSVLDRATTSAERALGRARASHRDGSEAVASGLAALDAVREHLTATIERT
ncbi:MAG TPA: dynamin family protein [Thermoanaerobaculia bacterium]|nr:dynamin family protein [Thermoanaerobaculia bacterium]